MNPLLIALCLSAPVSSALASTPDDDCTIEGHKNDRVAKGRDLVVEENAVVEDVVVVDGDVTLRKGVRARKVMALHGSILIESGAKVAEGLVAIGGKVHVEKGAEVKGSRIVLNHGLHVRGDDGGKVDLNLSINGRNVARELLKPVLEKIHGCKVVELDGPTGG